MPTIPLMVFLLMMAAPAAALDVTSCQTTVPRGQIGDLQADLVCGATETGVNLEARATLRMHGHSISGGAVGVLCPAQCQVEGAGEIFGSDSAVVTGLKKVVIHAVDVHDATNGIVSPALGELNLADVTVSNVLGGFALAAAKIRATNVTVTNSGDAVYGAVYANRLLKGTNIDVSGNPVYGVYSNGRIDVTGLVVTGNGEEGLEAKSMRLVDSTVTGNDAGGEGVDLRSTSRPRLLSSTCGASRKRFPGDPDATWDVCTGD